MSERYRNVFCYYRGPEHAEQTEKERALENNITKALINSLDLCPRLGGEFIKWLDGKIAKRPAGVGLDTDSQGIRWGILETPDKEKVHSKRIRIMLGIKRRNSEGFYRSTGTSRPKFDGVIEGSNWLIGIESKINGMNDCQFRQEKGWLDTKRSLIISWEEIHSFFCRMGSRQCTETERLFIEQFTGYLKEIGQLPFQGLKRKHFDFFTKGRGEREQERHEIRDLINTLGGDLWDYRDKSANIRELYEGAWDWVKGLNRNNKLECAELKFYLSSKRSIGNQCYLGISLDSEYPGILSVYACVGPENMFRRLLKSLRRDRNALCRILKKENLDGYSIHLFDKQWNLAYKKSLPKSRDAKLIASYLLELESSILDAKDNKDMSFLLTVDFKADRIANLPAERQLAKIAEAMEALHPFMQFLNNVR